MSSHSTDLDDLIYALLDGSITQEEHSRLQVSLKNLPTARERYHQLVEIHSLLENEAEQHSANSNIIPMESVVRRQRLRFAKKAALSAAALILFSAIILQFFQVETPDAVAANARFSEFSQFRFTHPPTEDKNFSDTMMREGSTMELEQGSAQLDFTSGVEAYVIAPAKITLTDQLHLKLEKGTVWFNVPPQAKGFTVSSAQLKVIDLGTQFGVIAKGEHHQVHVFKGLVEASCLYGSKETSQLIAGQARTTTSNGTLATAELNQAHFLTHLPKGLTYFQWNLAETKNADLATQGNAPTASDVETTFTKTKILTNSKGKETLIFKPGEGHITTSWNGIKSDRPRTITGWIKCPPHSPHPEGCITEWGVLQDGVASAKWRVTLNPQLYDASGTKGALRTEFGQGYIIGSTDLRDGKWHHFASVYDGSGYGDEDSIKLYIDGKREILSSSQPNAIETVLDSSQSIPCRIGRNFTGSIDKITVYQGVLPLREIRRQAQKGR